MFTTPKERESGKNVIQKEKQKKTCISSITVSPDDSVAIPHICVGWGLVM